MVRRKWAKKINLQFPNYQNIKFTFCDGPYTKVKSQKTLQILDKYF